MRELEGSTLTKIGAKKLKSLITPGSAKLIELHAPTSSTQKLKLMGKGGQFTYTPTLPLTYRLLQATYVEYWSGL
jgi:hypothetical protein